MNATSLTSYFAMSEQGGRRHQVDVSWTGRDGSTEFSEQYELDLEVLTALPESPPKGLHTIAEELEQFRGAINHGTLGRCLGGPPPPACHRATIR